MGRLSWIVWVSRLRVLSGGKPEGQSQRRRHNKKQKLGGWALKSGPYHKPMRTS